jgi:hypothetical protein
VEGDAPARFTHEGHALGKPARRVRVQPCDGGFGEPR